MNKILKTKWLKALRSGEYVQGKDHYVTTGKKYDLFCCLGVLCDIQDAVWDMNGYNKSYEIRGKTRKGDAYVLAGPDELMQRQLAVMNDIGISFDKIADYIKANL